MYFYYFHLLYLVHTIRSQYCLLLFCALVRQFGKGGCQRYLQLPACDIPCCPMLQFGRGINAVRSTPRLLCIIGQLVTRRPVNINVTGWSKSVTHSQNHLWTWSRGPYNAALPCLPPTTQPVQLKWSCSVQHKSKRLGKEMGNII